MLYLSTSRERMFWVATATLSSGQQAVPGTPGPSNSPERKSASVNKGEGVVTDCGGKTKRRREAAARMTGGGVCSGQGPPDNRLRPPLWRHSSPKSNRGKNHPVSSGFSSGNGGDALGLAGAGSREPGAGRAFARGGPGWGPWGGAGAKPHTHGGCSP